MKLQLAYDLGTYEELYPFMEEIEEAVDIIEIGTPVILREGVSQIEKVKKRLFLLSSQISRVPCYLLASVRLSVHLFYFVTYFCIFVFYLWQPRDLSLPSN